jgi:hypothetical protein
MALSKLFTKQATKKSGKELTERQKKALQKELDEVQAGKSRGKTLEEVEKSYTPAEIRQMERELEKIKKSAQGMAKGGKVTKMMKGGTPAKKMMGGGYGTKKGMK